MSYLMRDGEDGSREFSNPIPDWVDLIIYEERIMLFPWMVARASDPKISNLLPEWFKRMVASGRISERGIFIGDTEVSYSPGSMLQFSDTGALSIGLADEALKYCIKAKGRPAYIDFAGAVRLVQNGCVVTREGWENRNLDLDNLSDLTPEDVAGEWIIAIDHPVVANAVRAYQKFNVGSANDGRAA